MISANEIRQKYLEFFERRGHKIIPSAPLVPENDPTVLFTTAGMHPLVPYLLGQPHPLGKRLVDYQKCLRTDDIDEVGDTFHHTFFEMFGNWSLGDYFKKEAISWSYEFLTQELNIDPHRLYISCFAGDADASKDEESAAIWKEVGIPRDRIYFFGKKDNWWGPAGQTGPCGPDTEMYYDTTQKPCGPNCQPGDNCGRFCEIWNDVFMQYNKTADGKFEKLPQPNVDTGMGLERTSAVLNGFDDNYLTDLWQPIIKSIERVVGKSYEEHERPFRIIADHLRAAVFIISDGVQPSNKEQGYVLRRLLRRAAYQLAELGISSETAAKTIVNSIIEVMSRFYPELHEHHENISNVVNFELIKFTDTLKRNLPEFISKYPKKYPLNNNDDARFLLDHNLGPLKIDTDTFLTKVGSFQSLPSIAAGTAVFYGSASYGLPPDYSMNVVNDWVKANLVKEDIEKAITKMGELHQDLSRTASKGMFRGGLQDQSEITTKYHTATHLLHAALRQVLGPHVQQKGSNITSARLRFDFSHSSKLSADEIEKIETLVNQKIIEDIPVTKRVLPKSQALADGVLAFFPERYPDVTSVYQIGDFSQELCGGPHVNSTAEIGGIKITKEESAGSGIRRIYAQLSPAISQAEKRR